MAHLPRHDEALENSVYRKLVPESTVEVFKETMDTVQMCTPFLLHLETYESDAERAKRLLRPTSAETFLDLLASKAGVWNSRVRIDSDVTTLDLKAAVLSIISVGEELVNLPELQRQHALLLLDDYFCLPNAYEKLQAAKKEMSRLVYKQTAVKYLRTQMKEGSLSMNTLAPPINIFDETDT